MSFTNTLRVIESERKVSIFALASIVALLFMWVIWFLFAKISIYERSVKANIEYTEGVVDFSSPSDSLLISVLVKTGEKVRAGQILFELDHSILSDELLELVSDQLQLQSSVQLAIESEMLAQKSITLHTSVANSTYVEALAGIDEAKIQLNFLESKLKNAISLRKNSHISSIDLQEAEILKEKQSAKINKLTKGLNRLKLQLENELLTKKQILSEFKSERLTLSRELAQVSQQIYSIKNRKKELIFRAPEDGYISFRSVKKVGERVKLNEHILTFVSDKPLQVIANFTVKTSAGRLTVDQPVKVSLDAFPWIQYGWLNGTVSQVSQQEKEGYISVTIDLQQSSASNMPIKNGLTAIAVVQIDSLSPFKLLMQSLGSKIQNL